MVKKLLTLACGLLLSIGAMAQYSNPVVPQDSIRFWTGSGSNRAVIAITWNDGTAGNIGSSVFGLLGGIISAPFKLLSGTK